MHFISAYTEEESPSLTEDQKKNNQPTKSLQPMYKQLSVLLQSFPK